MAYLASLFVGWNVIVLVIFISLYGLAGLSKKFSFIEFLLILIIKSIGILFVLVFSPITYLLIAEHKENYGSFLGYIWGASKGIVIGEKYNE